MARISKIKKKEDRIISNLEEIAQSLQIPVDYEKFQGRGGLCSIYGRSRIIINRYLNPFEKIEILSKALNSFPLENIYIFPEIRTLLNKYGQNNNEP